VVVDPNRNAAAEGVGDGDGDVDVSAAGAGAHTLVVHAREDVVIAGQVRAMLAD